jgi:hypothetical protein
MSANLRFLCLYLSPPPSSSRSVMTPPPSAPLVGAGLLKVLGLRADAIRYCPCTWWFLLYPLCSAVSDFAHPLLRGRCEVLRMAQSDVPLGDSSSLAFFPHLMKDIDSRSSSAELSTTSAKIYRKDQEIILRFFPQACRTSYEDGRSLV